MKRTFKKRLAQAPLPSRNKREALLKRTAAEIENQHQLDIIICRTPEELRVPLFNELRPYLKFSPNPLIPEPEPVVD